MKEEIISNIHNPNALEKLYRENKTEFKTEFNSIYPEYKDDTVAQIWNERLNYVHEEISWGSNHELLFIIIASFIAALIAKIPAFTPIDDEFFYSRNIAFIVFPMLTAYFAWKQKLPTRKVIAIVITFLASIIYINVLPNDSKSNTLILACIHLPLFLWIMLGITFLGNRLNNTESRIDFLRYNGDLLVMTTIILIAGALLTAATLGLFELIDIRIENFYFEYIVIGGLAASPIVATYLVQTNPQLVNKVSPVIAKVFTPLVLITLIVYVFAVIVSGKDPYNDREFLMIFNFLLIGVMAIILFSIAESSKKSVNTFGTMMLLGLSIITVIINLIALSAIVFRISEWGFTPNRLAVLGGNILMLLNLFVIVFQQFKSIKNKKDIGEVEKAIAYFLPVYCLWTIIVTFLFPILFGFR